MTLELATPNSFPAFPYTPPYSIQDDLMRHLYTVIEQRKVTIVESPTGTGKTLSLLCASLTWLNDEKNRARKGRLDNMAGPSSSKEPQWVIDQTRERHQRELEDKENEIKERLARARRRERELKKRAKFHKKPRLSTKALSDMEVNEDDFLPESDTGEDEDDNLSPAVRALMARINADPSRDEEEPTCTKIYYASRTHSQLTQVLPELKRLKLSVVSENISAEENIFSNGMKRKVKEEEEEENACHTNAVALGSRKHLCINDDLRSKSMDLDEACRELLGEKGEKRCPHLPPLEEEFRMNDFRDQILATPKDIEDLATAGRLSDICPYFGSRRAIPQAELVTLPYNLLLQKSSREALGIDLSNQIVIIDEAHNLITTLLSLSTVRVSLSTLRISLQQVSIYVTKFRNRLSAQHLLHLQRLRAFLEELQKYLSEWKSNFKDNGPGKSEVISASELMERLGKKAIGINMLAIERYLKSSKIARKISGYADKQAEKGDDEKARRSIRKGAIPPLHAIEDLMLALAGATDDGRVILSLAGKEEVEIKYQLLNPSPHFKDVVEEARAVILAGGTMSPISDVINQLFSYLPPERITNFSCGHIIPSSNLLTIALTKGPKGGELEYKASRQSDPQVIAELGQIILNFTHTVPGGMIVFFPSYNFLNTAKEAWRSTGVLDKFNIKKKVFFEPEDNTAVESTLQEYTAAVQTVSDLKSKGGALLFAVIGAKLSEGLNFKDDLARAVLVVGMPFANLGSSELKERLKYVKRLEEKNLDEKGPGPKITKGKDAAAELYENMCMNAVNQSIGRAIRHQGDWAALILLDRRYASGIRNKLPKWIGNDLKVAQSFGQAVKEMGAFYRSKK
ncbi:DNA repair helicase [Dendrothele bispora CBS 962.96]|uniref:ATP-dependent DNA helicase CHL1 n=1 Tax=Dendrothele bispora (strain CBS 962.96) TaxID=1314807 RepID=A0A4S8MNK3_DENBC|nr:DNA repair helicase [Dendrothele bispora CBS 962.96]